MKSLVLYDGCCPTFDCQQPYFVLKHVFELVARFTASLFSCSLVAEGFSVLQKGIHHADYKIAGTCGAVWAACFVSASQFFFRWPASDLAVRFSSGSLDWNCSTAHNWQPAVSKLQVVSCGYCAAMVPIDLLASFDTVDWDILLHRL